ncbi:MAG: hypothetical protein ACRD2L_10625 [Terriglobia bacterium]
MASSLPRMLQQLMLGVSMKVRRIVSRGEAVLSAFKTYAGEVITGAHHGDAIEKLAKRKGISFEEAMKCIDIDNPGFVDTAGKYLSREEAAKAVGKDGELYSEHAGKMSVYD